MPQYIRENGAIKVIPDDNTTEDGEIDLSPRRKIIDEGDIIIEGRDDGSTVIREKRPEDHTFLSNPRSAISDQTIGTYKRAAYDSNEDLYIFYDLNEDEFTVSDPKDDYDTYVVSLPGSLKNLLPIPSLGKIFVTDDLGNYNVVEKNSSTGRLEVTRTNSLGSQSDGIIPLLYLNLVIFLGGSSIYFVDPVNESIKETVNGVDVSAGFFLNKYDYFTRSDRVVIFPTTGNTGYSIYPQTKEVSELGDLFSSVSCFIYLEKEDKYFYNNISTGEGFLVDASTFEVLEKTKPLPSGVGSNNIGIEGRFIVSPANSREKLTLIDGKDGRILNDELTAENFGLKDLSTEVAAYDSKRNVIFFTIEEFLQEKPKVGIVDYNPFYD
jgi:hypothetical protein